MKTEEHAKLLKKYADLKETMAKHDKEALETIEKQKVQMKRWVHRM